MQNGETYGLLHKSLMEYFAAIYVARLPELLEELPLTIGEGKDRQFRIELRMMLLFVALVANAKLKRSLVTRMVDIVKQLHSQNNASDGAHDQTSLDVAVNLDAVAGTDIFNKLPKPNYTSWADWLVAATGLGDPRKSVPHYYRHCVRLCGRHNALKILQYIVELVPESKQWAHCTSLR